jgi:hypothetical protein
MDGCVYTVVVSGQLGPRFAAAFEGMAVTVTDGHTEITGPVADRAQLRGLLDRVDDLGLTLVEVRSAVAGAEPDDSRSANVPR